MYTRAQAQKRADLEVLTRSQHMIVRAIRVNTAVCRDGNVTGTVPH